LGESRRELAYIRRKLKKRSVVRRINPKGARRDGRCQAVFDPPNRRFGAIAAIGYGDAMQRRTSGLILAAGIGAVGALAAVAGRRRATAPAVITVDPILDAPPVDLTAMPWEPAVERGRRAARKRKAASATDNISSAS
jgi:hypothetical protein